MSIKHKVIMINGAPGVGKSWLAHELYKASVGFQSDVLRAARRIKFASGIYDTVATMMGFPKDMSDKLWSEWKESYVRLNNGMNDGAMTGRELLIHVGELARTFDVNHWTKRMMEEIKQTDAKSLRGFLWIVDDLGFPEEFLEVRKDESFEYLTIYIGDIIESSTNAPSEFIRFMRDSRFNLSRYCHIKASTSSEALTKTLASIKNRGW